MAHSHDVEIGEVPVRPVARVVLLVFLAAAGAATVVGLVLLWPDGDPRGSGPEEAFAAPGVTFEKADVEEVQPACERPAEGDVSDGDQPGGADQASCGQVEVTVLSGASKGDRVAVEVPPEVSTSRA